MSPRRTFPNIRSLRAAIQGRRIVSFWCKNREFRIEPYGLLQAKCTKAWVLAGWCLERQSWRFFRFAELRDVVASEDRFPLRDDFPMEVPDCRGGWRRREA